MTKIIAIDAQTGKTLATLNNRGKSVFYRENYARIMKGKHAFVFTMLATNPKAQHFAKKNRLLVQVSPGVFEEFTIHHTFTNMKNEKTITATAAYTEMETAHIIEPGTYSGTLEKIAREAFAPTKYDLGLFEDFGQGTIHVTEPVGAYSFALKLASEFEVEMDVRIQMKGNKFTGRFVDYVKRIGNDVIKEIVYGENLLDIEMQEYTDRIATRLIGIGPTREDGSYLTSTVVNEEAFQRWNDEGNHITRLYRPETNDQNMSQARLDQLTEMELKKRIDSVVEYKVTAAFIEGAKFGSSLRVKNPKYVPPLYADARVIGVEGPLVNDKQKTYTIGEVKTYSEDEIYKTLRQLQAQYNMRVIRSAERPPGSPNKIWVEIVLDAAGEPTGMEVPHVWSTQLNDWVKIAPTTAVEIGAETPAGAQDKADAAETAAKDHAEQKDTEQAQIINQTINQTRIDLETDLAAKAGLTYVDGNFSLIDSDLSAMLGDINLITGDVSGITSRVDGLQAVSDDLQTRVLVNEDALLAGSGRMTTIETDVNELEGTMSTTITQLSNLDGKVTNQQTQIDANSTAITLKASQASLDTLTGEVSDISAELSVQAGQIALKAEQSALTTVDNKVTGLQSDVASLVVDVDGITSSVSTLRTDLDGLEIGGRNLFIVSKFIARYPSMYGESLNHELIIKGTDSTGGFHIAFLDADSEYVMSFNEGMNDRFYVNGVKNWVGTKILYIKTGSSESGLVEFTGKFYPLNSEYPRTVKVNLEKGNKATDWTPAPEDIDLSISNVQQFSSTVDQKADSIISDVTALTQTVDGHTTSISNAQSSITQLSNSVALKAEQTQVDSIAGQVSSVESEISSLTVDVSGITTNVSSLRSDLDGLEIGGRNFIRDISVGYSPSVNTVSSPAENVINIEFQVNSSSSPYIFLRALEQELLAGEEYTVSFYATLIREGATTFRYGLRNAGGSSDQAVVIQPGVRTKINYTFIPTTDGRPTPILFTGPTPIPQSILIEEFQVKKGNKITDFTEAPEETNAAIGAVGSRVTSAETSITQLSNSINLKASQASVDNLANRMSSAESTLSVQAGQISSKVSTTDYTGNKIASLINQSATTISIQASKINLVGAVNVLSEISGQLGNITAGTISGVTFTSVMGKKSFNLSNGLAEFIEDRSTAGVTLGTRTAINEDGVKVEYTYYSVVEHASALNARSLIFRSEFEPYTEYGLDKVELLANSSSKFGIYPGDQLTTIQALSSLKLQGGTNSILVTSADVQFSNNKYRIPSNGIPVTTEKEQGYMATSTVNAAATVNAGFTGVNFRTKKTYTPASISYTTVSSNINPDFYDISVDGFMIGLRVNNAANFYFFRGKYTA